MVNEAVAVAGKAGFSLATPFGRINMWITLGALLFLVVYGSIQSVQEKSVYPLLDAVVFRTVGADHSLSQSLDALPPIVTDVQPKFLSGAWFSYWWAMFVLWLNILIALYFIFLIIFVLYKLFVGLNNTNPLMNVAYAIIVFGVLEVIVGLALYPTLLAGQVMPSDKMTILNDAFSHSYPFEGVVKLVSRIVSGSLFDKLYAFIGSPIGNIVTNLPTTMINNTGV